MLVQSFHEAFTTKRRHCGRAKMVTNADGACLIGNILPRVEQGQHNHECNGTCRRAAACFVRADTFDGTQLEGLLQSGRPGLGLRCQPRTAAQTQSAGLLADHSIWACTLVRYIVSLHTQAPDQDVKQGQPLMQQGMSAC